jgi:predicted phage-related endonuclease
MANTELLENVRQFKELQGFITALQEEAEGYKQAIIEEMTSQQTDTLQIDVFTVKYTAYQSSRVDTTSLKKELPEIAERYTKTTESRRFAIV